MPHPNVHLVIEPSRSGIFGVASGRFVRTLAAEGKVFGVKFKPGGFRPFFGSSVAKLSNRCLPLEAVFSGASALEAEIIAQPDVGTKIAVMSDFLISYLPNRDENADRVANMVRRIEKDRSILSVEQLTQVEDIGLRSLQRLFCGYVGVSPKCVIRRYRLHEALERLALGVPTNWVSLALDLGYFDQSHFIRDFKSLVGQTPLEYAQQVEETRSCAHR